MARGADQDCEQAGASGDDEREVLVAPDKHIKQITTKNNKPNTET